MTVSYSLYLFVLIEKQIEMEISKIRDFYHENGFAKIDEFLPAELLVVLVISHNNELYILRKRKSAKRDMMKHFRRKLQRKIIAMT